MDFVSRICEETEIVCFGKVFAYLYKRQRLSLIWLSLSALSDQFYGDDKHHKTIRQEVCQFLRDHEEEYKYFVEDDRTLDHHVSTMEMDGIYGGNMELAAFARMKGINIRVYQPGMVWVLLPADGSQ